MGIREEIELIDKLFMDIDKYQKGTENFEKLYITLSRLTNSARILDENIRKELISYKNGFEVTHLYPGSSGLYEYVEDLPPMKKKPLDDELMLLISFLKDVKKRICLLYCRCCGYDLSDLIYISKGLLSQKCPCCGIPIEITKMPIEKIRDYRDNWMRHPAYWYSPQKCPEDWKFEKQVENIPEEYW